MTPFWFDLEVPRNGSDYREYQMVDGDDAPIDITGWIITAQARDTAGGAVIATGAVELVEPTGGTFSVKWIGSQFDAFGDPRALAVAAFDVKAIDPSGLPVVPVRGPIYITPEVTA